MIARACAHAERRVSRARGIFDGVLETNHCREEGQKRSRVGALPKDEMREDTDACRFGGEGGPDVVQRRAFRLWYRRRCRHNEMHMLCARARALRRHLRQALNSALHVAGRHNAARRIWSQIKIRQSPLWVVEMLGLCQAIPCSLRYGKCHRNWCPSLQAFQQRMHPAISYGGPKPLHRRAVFDDQEDGHRSIFVHAPKGHAVDFARPAGPVPGR